MVVVALLATTHPHCGPFDTKRGVFAKWRHYSVHEIRRRRPWDDDDDDSFWNDGRVDGRFVVPKSLLVKCDSVLDSVESPFPIDGSEYERVVLVHYYYHHLHFLLLSSSYHDDDDDAAAVTVPEFGSSKWPAPERDRYIAVSISPRLWSRPGM